MQFSILPTPHAGDGHVVREQSKNADAARGKGETSFEAAFVSDRGAAADSGLEDESSELASEDVESEGKLPDSDADVERETSVNSAEAAVQNTGEAAQQQSGGRDSDHAFAVSWPSDRQAENGQVQDDGETRIPGEKSDARKGISLAESAWRANQANHQSVQPDAMAEQAPDRELDMPVELSRSAPADWRTEDSQSASRPQNVIAGDGHDATRSDNIRQHLVKKAAYFPNERVENSSGQVLEPDNAAERDGVSIDRVGHSRVGDVAPPSSVDRIAQFASMRGGEGDLISSKEADSRVSAAKTSDFSAEQVQAPLPHPKSVQSDMMLAANTLAQSSETPGIVRSDSSGVFGPLSLGDGLLEWSVSKPHGFTVPVAAGGADSMVPRHDTIQNAARYAVEILAREPGKPVEIALNPEELGRVRISLSTSEAGVTVLVTSERPETLDLLRRNIDQLSQEFLRLGYEQASFEFNSEDTGRDEQTPKGERKTAEISVAANDTIAPQPVRLVQTGLDLRL